MADRQFLQTSQQQWKWRARGAQGIFHGWRLLLGAECKVVMTRVYLGEDNERASDWVRERERRECVLIGGRTSPSTRERRGTYAGCSAARLLALSCASCLGPYTYTQRCRRASERARVHDICISSRWLLELLFSREQEGVVSRKWALSEFELRVTHVLPSIHAPHLRQSDPSTAAFLGADWHSSTLTLAPVKFF